MIGQVHRRHSISRTRMSKPKKIKKLLRDVQVGDDLSGKTLYFDTTKTVRAGSYLMSGWFFDGADYKLEISANPSGGIVALIIGLPHGISRTNFYAAGTWIRGEYTFLANSIVTAINPTSYPDIDDNFYFSLSDAWYYE